MKHLIRSRHQAPYRGLGIDIADDPNAVDYYAILDLEILGARRYGRGFVDWLLANKNPLEILFRLADETGVVLLPGKGFGTPHPSARVSLANLDEPRLYQNRRHRFGRLWRNTPASTAKADHPGAIEPIHSKAAQAKPR